MRHTLLILLTLVAAVPCRAQRLTIVLDPARGGSEYGARIDEHTYEKQVTLDVANRLRALLTARDFNVVLTRDRDVLVTNEQRAAIANQNKAVACILLHATAAGRGAHLWASSLSPAPATSYAIPWDEAQSSWVDRSQRLTTEFATAFARSKLAVSSGHTWIFPLDNMECPALAIEIAPEDSDTTAADRDYQNRIAGVIANELLFWRGHTDVMQSILNPPPPPAAPRPEAGVPAKGAANGPSAPAAEGAVRPSKAAAPAGTAAGTSTTTVPRRPAAVAAPPRTGSATTATPRVAPPADTQEPH